MGKQSRLQLAQQKTEAAIKATNKKIEELGQHAGALYASLDEIQTMFDRIRGVPHEKKIKYEKIKGIRMNWKQQAENIALEYKSTEVKIKGSGAAGVGAGIAAVALGPAAAMGVATTFGVASTGTAISALTGAAATKAALAWLGGGALIAGGGGMAAGSLFLALTGPIGWTIAGISAVTSGLLLMKNKEDQERLETIFALINERDTKSYELAIVELSERIVRVKDETAKLNDAISKVLSFGENYHEMSEAQQYELGAYVNLMEASTQLLTNPILGLLPKFTEEDFEQFCEDSKPEYRRFFKEHKVMIISLANLLYLIKLDDKERKLLCNAFKKNKEFLSSIDVREFDVADLVIVGMALKHRYEARAGF